MKPTNRVMKGQNEKLAEALGGVCDRLCRWQASCADQEELERHCESCALGEIVELFDEVRGKAPA